MPTSAPVRIAAIVPALNAGALLPRCLRAIKASHTPVNEIIVFDDGSSDDTGAVGRAEGAHVIRHEGSPLGPGQGRNRAASYTRCDVLVFIDSDVVVHPDAIGRLLEALDAAGVHGAFGSYDDRPPARRVAGIYANLRHHYVHQNAPALASTFWAGLGMVRKTAFMGAGGFDPTIGRPSIEDIELGGRIIANGGRIRLVREAKATHLKDWTLIQLWRTDIFDRALPWSRLIAEGRSRSGELNGSAGERIVAVFAYLVVAGIALLAWTRWGAALSLVAAIIYCIRNRGLFRVLAKRVSATQLPQAVILHWLYHLYASLVFVSVIVASRLRQRWRLVRATLFTK